MTRYRVACSRIVEVLQVATIVVEAGSADQAADIADEKDQAHDLDWKDSDKQVPEVRDDSEDYDAELLDEDGASKVEEHAGTDADPGL